MSAKHVVGVAVLLTLLMACGQRQSTDVAGGPCSYDTVDYPAVILDIERFNSTECDISFLVVWDEEATDTILYSMQSDGFLAHTEVEKRGLVVGDTVCYKHYQISSGSCNPDMFSISLNKYRNATSSTP
jgi:hypothetical protein